MFANTSRPHSCKECEKLLVDLAAPDLNQKDTLDGVVVSMSLFDARTAFHNGCDLMRWIFKEWLEEKWPENQFLDFKFKFVIRGDIFHNNSEISMSAEDQFSGEHPPASAALFEVTAYEGTDSVNFCSPLERKAAELFQKGIQRQIGSFGDPHCHLYLLN
jgi:hypothetical protein